MNQSKLDDLLWTLAKVDEHLNLLNDNNDTNNPLNDDHEHYDDDHDHDHDKSNVNIAKATAMVVLFTASTLCGSIPFILNRWFKWTENNNNARSAIIVKCLLYFGGGVLLCTTFLHLLPEVNENIEQLQLNHHLPELNFHLAELLTCLGFFAMFFVEEIIHTYIHRHQKLLNDNSPEAAFQRGRSIRDSYLIKGRRSNINNNNNNNNNRKLSNISAKDDNILSIKSNGLTVQDLITNDIENQKYLTQEQQQQQSNDHLPSIKNESLTNHKNYNNNHHHHHHHHHHHDDHEDDHATTVAVTTDHNHHGGHGHGHGHSHLPTNLDEDMIVSSLRGLLVVLALSLHELFEGLAVGLESSAANVWYMFGAVSAHKLVLAFCVGVELIVTKTKLWLAIIYVITFAIVSPIGIGIGILVNNNNDDNTASDIPSAILQGLATGTLLYVVFFEILSKERSGLIAYFAFLIGFIVMFGLQFATGHEHTHSHGHGHSHEHNDENHHNDDDNDHNHPDQLVKSIDEQLKLLREATTNFRKALIQN